MKRLKLYNVDEKYVNYLKMYDSKVPDVHNGKQNRPFLGVVLSINEIDYFVPLASPKPKHKTMHNQIDFTKINNGLWGAMNFNNMIPVLPEYTFPINLSIEVNDDKKIVKWKNLLANQISWCNKLENREHIIHKAEKLHHIIVSGEANEYLTKRCCDFIKLEEAVSKYRLTQIIM